jgi:hypothetical protein
LLKVVAAPSWGDVSSAAAIGGDDAIDARLTQLENGQEPAAARLGPSTLSLSVLGAGVAVWAVVATLSAFGGPAALMRAVCGGS